jgi:hypothetical protein
MYVCFGNLGLEYGFGSESVFSDGFLVLVLGMFGNNVEDMWSKVIICSVM